MRKFSFMFVMLAYSFSCFAQENDAAKKLPKNEIGTHILSYSVYPFSDKYGHIAISNEAQEPFNILNGISYKRFIDRHIIRASFTYRNLENDIYNKWSTGNYDEYILKTGYERELRKTKFTPYLAADIGFFYINYVGSTARENSISNYDLQGFGAGISPAFGLKYKLTNHLSLHAESCLDLV